MISAALIKQLQAQINRFAGQGALTDAIPVTGVLDAETTRRAIIIATHAAANSGNPDLVKFLEGAEANPGFVQENFAKTFDLIKLFGNITNLPPAKECDRFKKALPFLIGGLAIAVGGTAIYCLTRQGSSLGASEALVVTQPKSRAPLYVLGAGVALVGGFFGYREYEKYAIRKKNDKIREDVVSGKIDPLTGFNAIMANNPKPPPTGPKVTVKEEFILPCETIFPANLVKITPGMDLVIRDQIAAGRCRP